MTKPIELILLGAGARGAHSYASYAFEHPGEVRFVGVAEPDPIRRQRFAEQHDLDESQIFASWQEILARGQIADGALITTQDQMHVEPAIAAMQAGYDVLLEKPMADSLEGCVRLVQTAEQTGRSLQICHVLRYTPFWRTLHNVLESGRIGEIVTVEHRENVAWWHMAHSFVRGNWRNKALSTPMILAKCCHDLDILVWNLQHRVKRLSSVGSLFHYRPESVGPEIPLRCTDGCPIEASCPWSAIGIYMDARLLPHMRTMDEGEPAPPHWPFITITNDLSWEGRKRAIEAGPYGRCVYRCDNDVVDHQTVTMELENGASVTLTMHGHSNEEHRSMRYDGTRATLRARFGKPDEIAIYDHGKSEPEIVPIPAATSGHGGGDWGTMRSFLAVLRGEEQPLTDVRASLESHLLAFAAEEARLSGSMIDMAAFRAQAELVTGD
ncbi:MAG: Gfo/Idh/MocA family oxidoreductase [Caldilineaceae bacterium]|nr:Gfo/Idh/MocA family oxidoreductase [Caldilineaceae bacterium]